MRGKSSNLIRPLPSYLSNRYQKWRKIDYQENKSWYQNLAESGQHPRSMIISCCDSRVHAMSLFGGESGDFFIHRNIANLIPPFSPDGDHHGTSAAIEYAVTVLKISHLLVLGHSNCGGVHYGYHVCNKSAEKPRDASTFITKWLEILQPAYDGLGQGKSDDERIKELEQRSIVHSLDNLMAFPFIKEAVADERLTLHGAWHDIGGGEMLTYDETKGGFFPVTGD